MIQGFGNRPAERPKVLARHLRGDGPRSSASTKSWPKPGVPLALFLHHPLFLDDPADPARSHAAVLAAASAVLVDLLAKTPNLRLVAWGRLHEHRRVERGGVT